MLHAGSKSTVNHLHHHYTTIYKTTTYPTKYPNKHKTKKPKPTMLTTPAQPPTTTMTPLSNSPIHPEYTTPKYYTTDYTTPKYYTTPHTYTPPPTYTTTYSYKAPHHYGTSHKHIPFTMIYHPTEREIYGEKEEPTSDDMICKNVVSKERNWCKNHKLICSVCSLRDLSFW